MITGACVLRSGGIYRPEHVAILAHMLEGRVRLDRFVCLTDMPVEVPLVERVELKHGWQGWWSKIELFRGDIFEDGERVLYFDLDTVITGSVQDIADRPEDWVVIDDFYHAGRYGSALMLWTANQKLDLYQTFAREPEKAIAAAGQWGDQAFIERLAPHAARWQAIVPGQVVSYKVHCGGSTRPATVPKNARVVCFHGEPRPWKVNDPWVRQLWRAA